MLSLPKTRYDALWLGSHLKVAMCVHEAETDRHVRLRTESSLAQCNQGVREQQVENNWPKGWQASKGKRISGPGLAQLAP
jgi:hypothetical protein